MECCRVGKIVEVPPDTIILGCEEGSLHMVHFILQGSCRLIQHLQVHVRTNSQGKKMYKMYEPKDLQSPISDPAEAGYASNLFNRKLTQTDLILHESVEEIKEEEQVEPSSEPTIEDVKEERPEPTKLKEEIPEVLEVHDALPTIEVSIVEEAINEEDEEVLEEENDETKAEEAPKIVEPLPETEEVKEATEAVEEEEEEEEEEEPFPPSKVVPPPVKQVTEDEEPEEEIVETDTLQVPAKRQTLYEENHHEKVLEECRRDSVMRRESLEKYKKCKPAKPNDVETHFMQIGLLYKGECFGLGESLKDRFIISVTKVKYLMIPRHFLLLHNPCNIWNRIKQFLTLYLPTDEKIMRNFVIDRDWAWNIRKESLRVVSMKEIPNFTLENDVPLSLRINERIVEEELFNKTEKWKVDDARRERLAKYIWKRTCSDSEFSMYTEEMEGEDEDLENPYM